MRKGGVRVQRKLALSEKAIESSIINALQMVGVMVMKIPNEATFRRKVVGTVRGAPDLVALLPTGEVYFIEVKAKYRDCSEPQQRLHEWMRKHGHKVIVARSVSDVQEVIERALQAKCDAG